MRSIRNPQALSPVGLLVGLIVLGFGAVMTFGAYFGTFVVVASTLQFWAGIGTMVLGVLVARYV